MPTSSRHSQTRAFSLVATVNICRKDPEFSIRITSILTSRFLLDLQAVDRRSAGMVSSTRSQVESAIFQRVIGSLGSDVDFGGDFDVNDIETNGVSAGDGGTGDLENNSSVREYTEEGAAEAVAED